MENHSTSSVGASSGVVRSTFRTSSEDEAMAIDGEEMVRSDHSEYDDEWPQLDIFEDKMNFDPNDYD